MKAKKSAIVDIFTGGLNQRGTVIEFYLITKIIVIGECNRFNSCHLVVNTLVYLA
jgi:hypothetical protein